MRNTQSVHAIFTFLSLCLLTAAGACNQDQQQTVDSAAASVEASVRSALSVIDIDAGRHIDADNKVTNRTDQFAPTDTIYASVHTSGTATNSAVVGRWTFEDSTVVGEQTQTVTTNGDAYASFFLVDPAGLAKGTYTLHVLIGGREIRSKEVTVS